MVIIKIRPQKEKKIEAKRGEVYLISFDPLKKKSSNQELKTLRLKTHILPW